jgi:hypothetical protein
MGKSQDLPKMKHFHAKIRRLAITRARTIRVPALVQHAKHETPIDGKQTQCAFDRNHNFSLLSLVKVKIGKRRKKRILVNRVYSAFTVRFFAGIKNVSHVDYR